MVTLRSELAKCCPVMASTEPYKWAVRLQVGGDGGGGGGVAGSPNDDSFPLG